jgi:transcriptional regulator with XRE-family HTH domain
MPRAPRSDDLKTAVGLRLRAAREALELSAKEICEAIGVQPNRYSQWENGKNLLDPIAAIEISRLYGITLDYLYRGDLSGLKHSLVNKLQQRAC